MARSSGSRQATTSRTTRPGPATPWAGLGRERQRHEAGDQQHDPRPDRRCSTRRRATSCARASPRSSASTATRSAPRSSVLMGPVGEPAGAAGPRGLPGADLPRHGDLLPHRKMSVAAMVALLHDMVFTVGIYAMTGFEVSPATMIGFLTVLGYSLYDTVVVFDKVRENTRGVRQQAQQLRRGREPRREPDGGALDQHHGRGAPADRGRARASRSSVPARCSTCPPCSSSAWRSARTPRSSSRRRSW